jgi:predicted acylesterase/phospholipase RssA
MVVMRSALAVGFPLLVTTVLAGSGCQTPAAALTPTRAGINPADLIDLNAYGDGPGLPVMRDLFRVGEQIRTARRPDILPAKKTCLVLSGGGAYGAYQAGVLFGWSETGTRPSFDSITGVSTGALVATLVFLGPEYDYELRRVYTSVKTNDIYIRRSSIQALLSNSLADNAPLARQINTLLTPEAFSRLGAEHRKGRRLYVGTTDLDGRRPVVWDIGAIAAHGTPEDRELITRVLLASAAIPGFFPPTEIPVEVDGNPLIERHVDGGVTQGLFIRPPHVPLEFRQRPPADFLYDSDLYVIVAGKLYADPEDVKPRVLKIAESSISTLLFAETRVELVKLYMAGMLAGMNYRLAAIPPDYPAPKSSTEFDPAMMTGMFEEGRRQVLAGTAWRSSPPGVEDGELMPQRATNRLTRTPRSPSAGSDQPTTPNGGMF